MHALNQLFVYLWFYTHVEIFAIFERLISTTLFLELDHFVNIWLLKLLDVIKLLANLVLSILALNDKVIQDRLREVRFFNLLRLVG